MPWWRFGVLSRYGVRGDVRAGGWRWLWRVLQIRRYTAMSTVVRHFSDGAMSKAEYESDGYLAGQVPTPMPCMIHK